MPSIAHIVPWMEGNEAYNKSPAQILLV